MEEEEEENHHQQSKRKRNNEEMNTEAETLKKQPKTDTPSVVGPTKPADIQTKKKKKGTTTALGGGGSLAYSDSFLAALQFQQLYLQRLPSAEMYEKSYMHRDNVTHTAISRKDFVITGSKDGHVKFWKKKPEGVEFVKHFRAHVGTASYIYIYIS